MAVFLVEDDAFIKGATHGEPMATHGDTMMAGTRYPERSNAKSHSRTVQPDQKRNRAAASLRSTRTPRHSPQQAPEARRAPDLSDPTEGFCSKEKASSRIDQAAHLDRRRPMRGGISASSSMRRARLTAWSPSRS